MPTPSSVEVRRESVVLPTYEPHWPDINPMFLEKRVYQGSSGRVYPLPFTDRIAEKPAPRSWDAVFIENDFLRVMILPQLGGRIHRAQDKTNGYDFIYYQPVIKPALVGLAGPWASGGIEFNWPQHHRPSTFMPADVAVENHPDGSATVWLSEHDPMARMKGMHGVRLHPGKSYLELVVRVYNRTQDGQTFLWWANVAARVHGQYQSFFPPDTTHVADHAKRATSAFPLATGSYYGVDYAERGKSGIPPNEIPRQYVPPHCQSLNSQPSTLDYSPADLSWYANIPVPTSYMGMGSRGDFAGGYDHRAHAGLVHVANHHISPGKKQWTWGNHEFGYAWDRNLTDPDERGEYGPYIELMAGVYTDNQPDFSFLQPGETKTWSQYWYPIRAIGPAQMANVDAAVSLRLARGVARLGVAVTAVHSRATVTVAAVYGRRQRRSSIAATTKILATFIRDLSPDSPLIEQVDLPRSLRAENLTITVLAHAGAELIAYRPEAPTTMRARERPLERSSPSSPDELPVGASLLATSPTLTREQARSHNFHDAKAAKASALPAPATEPPPPAEVETNDELFLIGLHLEQYRHATRMPELYWREALRRDPGDARCHLALGRWHLRRGEFTEAEKHLRASIARLTSRNPNPADGEAHYQLGLCLRHQADHGGSELARDGEQQTGDYSMSLREGPSRVGPTKQSIWIATARRSGPRDDKASDKHRLLSDAYAAFYKATWNHAWQPAGYHALAEIDALRGDWTTALDHLDRALRVNAENLRARNLKVIALRRLGRETEAAALLRETLALDPLDWWARHLQDSDTRENQTKVGRDRWARRQDARGRPSGPYLPAFAQLRRGDPARSREDPNQKSFYHEPLACDAQVKFDLALDYSRAGLFSEALAVLADVPPPPPFDANAPAVRLPDASLGTTPMVHYYRAWLCHQLHHQPAERRHLRAAAKASPDHCFPARLEEITILEHAIAANPRDARAPYYLGNLLYDRRRHRAAIALWERAVALEPDNAVAWRNLGIGYCNILRQPAKARAAYERAFCANPRDARLLFERDQLWKRLGEKPARRLRELLRHPRLVRARDDLSVELCALYNQTGAPQKALPVVSSRKFQPWEGGEGQALGQHVRTRLALGRRALRKRNTFRALHHLNAALTPPENLGEARHLLANQSDIHYWLGCAHAASGAAAGARSHWTTAAEFKGDFQGMSVRAVSEMSYYSALSLQKLGRKAEATKLLRGLLAHARRLAKTPATIDYFATSLPTMLLFDDDLTARQRTTALFLEAQARLGLGQRAAAGKLLREVLRRDPSHAMAADLIQL